MKFVSFMFLAVLGFITHSFAWVFGWWPFQIIDWIYLFFMAVGACTYGSFKRLAPNITPFYWFLNILSLAANWWCFFGEGHATTGGKFFGSIYLMCSLIIMFGVADFQIKNRNPKGEDENPLN
jgi:hypothetical protein